MSRTKALESKIAAGALGATPGVLVRAFVNGKLKINLSVGQTYKYYDLASLTKVVSTVSLLMRLFDQKRFDPKAGLSKYISWFEYTTSCADVLSHSAGFPWWIPVYQKLIEEFPNYQELSLSERGFFLEKELRSLSPSKPEKAIYSDVDFFFLKSVLQNIFNTPINIAFDEFAEILNLKHTKYNINNKASYEVSTYAPTENCPWRHKILQGEVHDDNTWSLGGVSSHAGLFGSMDDLSIWALELRKALKGQSKIWSQKSAKLFTSRAVPNTLGDWTLGFMMPSSGLSSSGKYFSENSFGHTGFTGTSVWFDPKKDFIVLILSNRVHPTRKNEEFKQLRPLIHDWCYEYCWS